MKTVINATIPKRRIMVFFGDKSITIDQPIQFFYTGTILGVEKDDIDKEIMINFRSITDWELLGYNNTVDILNFSILNSPINEQRKFHRLSTYFDNLEYTSNVKIQCAFGMLLTEASRGARYWRASSNNAYLYDNPISLNSKICSKTR